MSTVEARVETERSSRYLVQLCKHASAIDRSHGDSRGVQVAAEWSETDGTIAFTPWGRCTLHADTDALTLRIEAAEEDLERIQGIIASHLDRFGRNELAVPWQLIDTPPDAQPHRPTFTDGNQPATRFRRINRITLASVAVVALFIALHVGLGGAAMASAQWTSTAIGIVAAILLLKTGLVALGVRHHRPAKAIRAHLSKGRA